MLTYKNIRCPFLPGTMITDPNKFWGRVSEQTTIISRLENMGSSVIIGSRRIGKSSLAYIVYQHCLSNLSNCEPIWVDCQSNYFKTVDGLFQYIKANSSLDYCSGQTKRECLKGFENAVKASKNKTILFIDEFELLTELNNRKQFDKPFFEQFRMLAGQGGKLALVLISKSPLQEICKHTLGIDSPFYNIFAYIPLDVFSEKESNDFLRAKHDHCKFSKKEIEFIKEIKNYRHPLVLQVACEAVFLNRRLKEGKNVLFKKISERAKNYLNHDEVQYEREQEKNMVKARKETKSISKPLDLFISIIIPVLGFAIIIFEFGYLIQYLDNFKAVLLAIFSVLVGMVILVFAGRSINIIGETTFYKLFIRLIAQIPLFSNILNIITNVAKNIKK